MIAVRKSTDRGYADHGWLRSYHSFSFADYYDPQEMAWGSLRVINEDRVLSGKGFGTHGHRDMEIISYVLEGQLQHQDSMGNGTVIQPGDVQRMSAGTGVQHSEFNPSSSEPVHFLQIWIEPASLGMKPSYEQKFIASESKRGRLRLIASSDGREDSVKVHQNVDLYASLLDPDEQVSYRIADGHLAYLHLVKGIISVNNTCLSSGDAAKIESENELVIVAKEGSELLLFDLA
ncbi:MAG TPA: pirin family protein [Burkholderiales bacterium]|nr:pirin family protein [Burkholderiales bacterium]